MCLEIAKLSSIDDAYILGLIASCDAKNHNNNKRSVPRKSRLQTICLELFIKVYNHGMDINIQFSNKFCFQIQIHHSKLVGHSEACRYTNHEPHHYTQTHICGMVVEWAKQLEETAKQGTPGPSFFAKLQLHSQALFDLQKDLMNWTCCQVSLSCSKGCCKTWHNGLGPKSGISDLKKANTRRKNLNNNKRTVPLKQEYNWFV